MAELYGFTRPEQVERTKLSRKVLYYFAMFAIINEILRLKIANTRVRPTYYCRRYGPSSVRRASCEERGGWPSRRAAPFELRDSRR